MSAWVIGLGVAAGYLVNKNQMVVSRIDNAVAHYSGGDKRESTGGSSSVEIDKAKLIPLNHAIGCDDINNLISGGDVKKIESAMTSNAAEVRAYDSAASPPEIIGVMLQVGV